MVKTPWYVWAGTLQATWIYTQEQRSVQKLDLWDLPKWRENVGSRMERLEQVHRFQVWKGHAYQVVDFELLPISSRSN